jgi:hypothetical protein
MFVLGMYLVRTGTYWYEHGKTKKLIAHNCGNRTVDLMHSILRAIPLRYQRIFHGDIYGYYKVYIH